MKQSKRLKARDQGINFSDSYELKQAVSLVKERALAKFDETIDVVFNCNLDPRKAEQNIRGVIDLPEGTGKTVRVAVFAEGAAAKAAQEAGADIVGGDALIERVQGGHIEFDCCIATPDMMLKLSKLGRILGPRGLMPNPKLGTVTQDVASAIKANKGGRITVRPDKAGIIHAIIGKSSFTAEALMKNFEALYAELLKLRPPALKGGFLKRIFMSSTMGFSLKVSFSGEKGLVFSKE